MNCPHCINETALNVAMCPHCAEFAASYSKALIQSMPLANEKNQAKAGFSASLAEEKGYYGKTA